MADFKQILRQYTNKEIYNGVETARTTKIGKTPVQDYEKPYRLVSESRRSMPLRLNSYIVNNFLSGRWKPKQKTIDKIKRFDYYAKYAELRQAGANIHDARKYAREDRASVDNTIDVIQGYIRSIANLNNTSQDYVRWGLSESEFGVDDWEEYINQEQD